MDDSVNKSLKETQKIIDETQKTIDDQAAKTQLIHLKDRVINNIATDADRAEIARLEASLKKGKDSK